MFTRTILTAVVALGLVGSASAFVSWTTPDGSGSFFDFSNGGSDNGLFGNPVGPIDAVFAFTPTNFTAPDNGNDTTVDRIEVDLTETTGEIEFIRVVEFGNYINTGGPAQVFAQATQLHSYDIFNPVQDSFSTGIGGAGSGSWSLETEIAVPADVTSFTLVFENRLQATGNARIFKNGVRIITPEPTSLLLLSLTAFFIRRR